MTSIYSQLLIKCCFLIILFLINMSIHNIYTYIFVNPTYYPLENLKNNLKIKFVHISTNAVVRVAYLSTFDSVGCVLTVFILFI